MQYHGNNGLQVGVNNGRIYHSGGGGNKNNDDAGAIVILISIVCLMAGVYGLLHYREVLFTVFSMQLMALLGSSFFAAAILWEERSIAWQDAAMFLWNIIWLLAITFLVAQVYQHYWGGATALHEVREFFSQASSGNKFSNFLHRAAAYLWHGNYKGMALAGIGWIGAMGVAATVNAVFALSNFLRFFFPACPAMVWRDVLKLNAVLWIPIAVIWATIAYQN